MASKAKPYEYVVSWYEEDTFHTVPEYRENRETFTNRKEAIAKLRSVATNPGNRNLKLTECWSNSAAVEAK